MNLFDKIKNFFKNIGKKQQALPEPEMMEEMPTEGNKNAFRDNLKFDKRDLLDSRTCPVDERFSNILRVLGVNEKILNNPQISQTIFNVCHMMLEKKGLTDEAFALKWGKNLSKEQLDKIIETIKSNAVLSPEEKNKTAYDFRWSGKSQNYFGIKIDPETGSVEWQSVTYLKDDPQYHQNEQYRNSTNTVSIDENTGEIKYEHASETSFDKGSKPFERPNTTEKYEISYKNGMQMRREDQTIDKDGNVTRHSLVSREGAVAQRRSDLITGQTQYGVCALDNLWDLSDGECQEGSARYLRLNEEELEEYLEVNADRISEAFSNPQYDEVQSFDGIDSVSNRAKNNFRAAITNMGATNGIKIVRKEDLQQE